MAVVTVSAAGLILVASQDGTSDMDTTSKAFTLLVRQKRQPHHTTNEEIDSGDTIIMQLLKDNLFGGFIVV